METPEKPQNPEDTPPLFRSWNRLYAAVLIFLAILITFFYFFGQAFQ